MASCLPPGPLPRISRNHRQQHVRPGDAGTVWSVQRKQIQQTLVPRRAGMIT